MEDKTPQIKSNKGNPGKKKKILHATATAIATINLTDPTGKGEHLSLLFPLECRVK